MSSKHKLFVTVLCIGLILWLSHELKLHLPDLEHKVATLGVWAPLGFIALFVALTPMFVSVDALCFAAGVLLPLVMGIWVVIMATYLSAVLIFFIGRTLLRTKVLTVVAKYPYFAQLDTIINDQQALKILFLLRLTPLPFAMFSYALSVTRVKFWPYLVTTSGILVYNASLCYLGYATKHLSGVINQATTQQSQLSHGVLLLGLVFLVAILVYVVKIARQKLQQLQIETAKPRI